MNLERTLDFVLKSFSAKGNTQRQHNIMLGNLRDAHEACQQARLVLSTSETLEQALQSEDSDRAKQRRTEFTAALLNLECFFLSLSEELEDVKPVETSTEGEE
jgi:hypothetical protein